MGDASTDRLNPTGGALRRGDHHPGAGPDIRSADPAPATSSRRSCWRCYAGRDWADEPAAVLEDRELKHRSKTATRAVPAPPPLVRALRWHVAAYGHTTDGRLFFVPTYGNKPVSKWSYAHAWRQARTSALTAAQQRSPFSGAAVRPAPRRHLPVAQRRSSGHPGSRMGRAQRPRAAQGVRAASRVRTRLHATDRTGVGPNRAGRGWMITAGSLPPICRSE